jgi:hypothetical protein
MTKARTIRRERGKETWTDLCERTRGLCQVAYLHALKHEPHRGAPGLDIDAIHDKERK